MIVVQTVLSATFYKNKSSLRTATTPYSVNHVCQNHSKNLAIGSLNFKQIKSELRETRFSKYFLSEKPQLLVTGLIPTSTDDVDIHRSLLHNMHSKWKWYKTMAATLIHCLWCEWGLRDVNEYLIVVWLYRFLYYIKFKKGCTQVIIHMLHPSLTFILLYLVQFTVLDFSHK